MANVSEGYTQYIMIWGSTGWSGVNFEGIQALGGVQGHQEKRNNN